MLRLAFTKFRALWLVLVVAVAVLPITPATGQTNPRWGVLAKMAERDLRNGSNLASFRWDETGKKLNAVWFVGDPTLFGESPIRESYQLDEQSGVITLRRGKRTETFRAQANGKLFSLTNSRRYIWAEGTDVYVFEGNRWVSELGGVSRRLAKAIASGHVRAANPDLINSIQSAQVAQVASATAAPTFPQQKALIDQSDPQWGILSQLVERDFEGNKFPVTVRWIVPGKSIRFTMWAMLGNTEFEIALDEQTGQLIENKKPVTITANGDLLSHDGKPMLWLNSPDHYVYLPSGYKLNLRPLRDGNLSRMIEKRVASGKVRAANPELNAVMASAAPPPATIAITQPQAPPTPIYTITQGEGPRLALVIGNSTYGPSMGALPNPANDADAMSAALKSLGFTVHLVKNADQNTMKRAIVRFGQRLTSAGKGATGLFFYAGHGIQHRGINYLIPVSAQISSKADVDIEAVAADTVLDQMEEAGSSTNIVILDACRNMPLARGFRSAAAGLAPMDAPNGSFIAYSTAPGSVAADGAGANSPFVTALIKNIGRKGEPIESIFRDVRRSVRSETEGAQTPWDSSSLIAPFYFAQP